MDTTVRHQSKPLLSVVVPCFNEEEVIAESASRLIALADSLNDYPIELIFVDDGSRDSTWRQLEGIAVADSRVKLIRFARNFGHQIAVTAGVDASNATQWC